MEENRNAGFDRTSAIVAMGHRQRDRLGVQESGHDRSGRPPEKAALELVEVPERRKAAGDSPRNDRPIDDELRRQRVRKSRREKHQPREARWDGKPLPGTANGRGPAGAMGVPKMKRDAGARELNRQQLSRQSVAASVEPAATSPFTARCDGQSVPRQSKRNRAR